MRRKSFSWGWGGLVTSEVRHEEEIGYVGTGCIERIYYVAHLGSVDSCLRTEENGNENGK